jgi:hypothetical protein
MMIILISGKAIIFTWDRMELFQNHCELENLGRKSVQLEEEAAYYSGHAANGTSLGYLDTGIVGSSPTRVLDVYPRCSELCRPALRRPG